MSDERRMQEMLGRCAGGCDAAFNELYNEASPKLYAMLLFMLKKPELAEDVLQEAFVKIWKHAGDYQEGKGAPMTWMSRITRNQALDRLRKIKREPMGEDPDSWDRLGEAIATDFMVDLEADCDMQRVVPGLSRLPEHQRRCILLAYCYGYTHEELSKTFSAPLGTIKSWVRRGLVKVRESLEHMPAGQPYYPDAQESGDQPAPVTLLDAYRTSERTGHRCSQTTLPSEDAVRRHAVG